MPQNNVEMGWAAAPMQEQHPALPDDIAAHFDRDNADLVRLKIRGIISDAEMRNAERRFAKKVRAALTAALNK